MNMGKGRCAMWLAVVAAGLVCGLGSQADAELFDVMYAGTVDGSSTDFGSGTEVNFMATYDSDDLDISGEAPAVPFQSVSITVGGVLRTGVSGGITGDDEGGDFTSLLVSWDGPPLNPDLSIAFEFPGAGAAFPNLSAVTLGDIIASEINHDGALPDPMAVTSFSITPEPSTTGLLIGLVVVRLVRLRSRRDA